MGDPLTDSLRQGLGYWIPTWLAYWGLAVIGLIAVIGCIIMLRRKKII